MQKKIKQTKSEKLLLIFLILLAIFSLISFTLIKNKCLFVEKVNLTKLNFNKPENIVILNVPCGNVVIELFPSISPNSVERFKYFIKNGSYNRSSFYRVVEGTLVQAGDLEYGNIDSINYYKVGSGQSKLGSLKSELNEDYPFDEGTVALARRDELDTEDSEFFIILKNIPLYKGEYTPLGKVIYGLDALRKIKAGNKSEYVLRPDFINFFNLLEQYY